MILPSGPAGVGVFEAATLVALQPWHVERSSALSCARVRHAIALRRVERSADELHASEPVASA